MDSKPTELKKIPNSITKEGFIKMYHPVPAYLIIPEINEIIFDKRKNKSQYQGQTQQKIKRTKTIFRDEILEYIKRNDLPNGYEI